MKTKNRKNNLLLAIVFILIATIACGSEPATQSQQPQESQNGEDAPITPNTNEPSSTPTQPTNTPEPTPVPPTPTPLPIGLSRSNPYPSTEIASAPNWDVQVLETIRGEQAWIAIQGANMFNEPPPEGMEYLLVKLRVKSTYSDSDEHSISSCDFDVTGDRLILYTCGVSSIVEPDPILDARLYTGGETEGWAGYLVGVGEGNLILVVNESFSFDENSKRFIALDEGASISVPADLKNISPTDFGKERNNPAARSEKVVTEDWEVSIVEVIRGEEAWQMALEENQFNDPPADGMEYVAVKVHVKYIGEEDDYEMIDGSFFNSTGSNGVLYDLPFVVDPYPALDEYLFPGGETEGWVVLQVAQGETNLILVFESWFDFSGESKRFISLEP